jgi:gliding motility-associated-like protein
LDPSLELSGEYLYLTQGADACSHLTDTAIVDITVNPLPVITFTADPDSGCHPLLVRFTNTTDPQYIGGFCTWSLGDGTTGVGDCDTFEHTYAEPGWYHVQLEIVTPQGCVDELLAPGAVLVQPEPEALFTWTPDPGIPDNSNITLTALDPYATVFQWTFPDGDTLSGRQVQHFFQHELSSEYEVCLAVLDRYGCADTACAMVPVVAPSIFVPNAFTPNGDGLNDDLRAFVDGFTKEEFTWRIFDRWGHVVFETTDNTEPWDGGALPHGTYVWTLSARPIYASEKVELQGHVTLVK